MPHTVVEKGPTNGGTARCKLKSRWRKPPAITNYMTKPFRWADLRSKPMKCDVCDNCWTDPQRPGYCVYGGPYEFRDTEGNLLPRTERSAKE